MLNFRAGAAAGEIKPVWHERGGERHASWAEAGSSHAFVESARLMDLERQVAPGDAPASYALFLEAAARELDGTGATPARRREGDAGGSWKVRELELTGKHAQRYTVAVWAPKGAPSV